MKRIGLIVALALGVAGGNAFAYERDNNRPNTPPNFEGGPNKDYHHRDSQLEQHVNRLNRMLGHVRWELSRYRGNWQLKKAVRRISEEVDRVNYQFRHGSNGWRIRRDVDRLRGELHRIEVELKVRRGDWYRW